MRKTIVFDFDKTLTYKDSLRELFLQEMSGWKVLLRIVYLCLAVMSKFHFITVRKEKESMIRLLFRSDKTLFASKCRAQAKSINLNPVFEVLKSSVIGGDRVIVLSASSVYLLEEVFLGLDVEIFGTTFISEGGRIIKINQHPYCREKLDVLFRNGIKKIDEMYYDSINDECLIPLCRKWNRVKDGVVVDTHIRYE